MKTSEKIIEFIEENGPSRVKDITEYLGYSPQAIHRQLKKLTDIGRIQKRGSPPVVFYTLAVEKRVVKFPELHPTTKTFINQQFFRISPDGRTMNGVSGFQDWVIGINQVKAYQSLAQAYLRTRKDSLNKIKGGFAVATQKIIDTFNNCYLEELIYQDFWSIPQFGKTKLGHLVTMGKSGQQRKAIKQLAISGRPLLLGYIKQQRIEAIAFAPHSIPRKLVFLKTYEKLLALGQPTTLFVKAVVDGHPVAQKSLPKLSDRIENARNTIFLANHSVDYKRVLIIDDALGSGATMNEMAGKLRKKGVEKIFGFAIVGSLKGFDIIPDV